MFANKYTLNLQNFNTGTTEQYISGITLSTQFQIVDNDELINRLFVKTEAQNAVNKILDYDRVRYMPITPSNDLVSTITYDLTLFDSGSTYVTNYGGIGFQYDDVKFRKNSFSKTFLRLTIFDSADAMTQNLVGFITLFSKLRTIDLEPSSAGIIAGVPKPINDIPINYTLENPIVNRRGFAEGFHLYYYRDVLNIGDSKYLYMKASFNNAKTGKATNLMVKNTPQSIENLVNELYIRIIISRTTTGYYYTFDDTYQGNQSLFPPNTPNNITFVGTNVNVRLYEVDAL
jgi:hypothetical protein